MDIGGRIRSARMNAGLTQEQAADVLGVSRQTISNWENDRTYPDIVSVIKMSDIYVVSLDKLLKGDETPLDYLDYLGESTDVVKSRDKLSKLILLAVYLGIWALCLIVFWLFLDPGDAMGYSLMFLIILLPVTTFVISVLIGRNSGWGKPRWLLSVVFGVMYMLAYYATFSAKNMAAFHKFNIPSFEMIPAGVMISLTGMAVGAVVGRLMSKNK